jgi:hypothetical protein
MSQPGPLIVTSAMRTGSTWLFNLLLRISGGSNHYVTSIDDALKVVESKPNAVIKTHAIIDIDWPALPAEVSVVRIVRNYKDSLLSRALYVKNIRPKEGEPITESSMRELIAELGDVSTEGFVRAFVERSPLVDQWLAEIAVMERGENNRCLTVMYEGMMFNPYQMMVEIVSTIWPDWDWAITRVESAVKLSIYEGLSQREMFLRNEAVGVGGWENWLTAELSDRLDAKYFELKRLALQHPTLRWHEILKKL